MAGDIKFCRKCGTKNSIGAKFCIGCGEAFVMVPPTASKSTTPNVAAAQPVSTASVNNAQAGVQSTQAQRPVAQKATMVTPQQTPQAMPNLQTAAPRPVVTTPQAPKQEPDWRKGTKTNVQDTSPKITVDPPKKSKLVKVSDDNPNKKAYETRGAASLAPITKKKGINGNAIIAIVLVIAIFFVTAFGYPGFLRSKPGKDSFDTSGNKGSGIKVTAEVDEESSSYVDYLLPTEYEMKEIATGTVTEEERTLSDAGVRVTIEDGFMGDASERDVKVSRVTENVEYTFDGEEYIPLTMYDVKVDGITEHSLLTIELPMDKSKAPLYGAGYIDEKTGQLVPAINEYDPDTGMLTIYTTHLTTFCGIPIENEKTRNAALSYITGAELLEAQDDIKNFDPKAVLEILRDSFEGDGSLSVGLNNMDRFSILQTAVSAASDAVELSRAEIVSTVAEGSSKVIYMTGNVGTIGEILNTNFGKAGTWSQGAEWGRRATTAAPYEMALKEIYPPKTLSNLADKLNNAGRILALYKIAQNINKTGWTSKETGTDIYKFVLNEMMALYLEYGNAAPALGIYMTGVGIFACLLDYVYSEALSGRKQVYISAYQRYYSSDKGHWSDDKFMEEFRKAVNESGDPTATAKVIDDYVNKFWEEADSFSPEYFESIITPEDKAAWGIAGQAGLTPEIRKEISENYKARLMKERIPKLLEEFQRQMELELIEKYQRDIDQTRRHWNQKIILTITSEDRPSSSKEKSKYAGCVARFKGITTKVNDPDSWSCVLNSEGSGEIKFTLLAHMLNNPGTEIEVVKMDGIKERLLCTESFKFKEYFGEISCMIVLPDIEIEETEAAEYNEIEAYGHRILLPAGTIVKTRFDGEREGGGKDANGNTIIGYAENYTYYIDGVDWDGFLEYVDKTFDFSSAKANGTSKKDLKKQFEKRRDMKFTVVYDLVYGDLKVSATFCPESFKKNNAQAFAEQDYDVKIDFSDPNY
ncbi:MAG: hypothetical protein Q4B67_02870 [Eubacteriales bacterium]|nr:hypothetical protein [Eubacteriales bacterium]